MWALVHERAVNWWEIESDIILHFFLLILKLQTVKCTNLKSKEFLRMFLLRQQLPSKIFSAPGRFSPSHQHWPLHYSDFYPQNLLLPFSWTTVITKLCYLHSACGLWDIPVVKYSSCSSISSLCCIPLYEFTSIYLPIQLLMGMRIAFILIIGYYKEHICEYCVHVLPDISTHFCRRYSCVRGLPVRGRVTEESGRPVPQAVNPWNSLSPAGSLRKQAPSVHSQGHTNQNGD